jgi:hypothetical protein
MNWITYFIKLCKKFYYICKETLYLYMVYVSVIINNCMYNFINCAYNFINLFKFAKVYLIFITQIKLYMLYLL